MKALTLHRPWTWAIFNLPERSAKRVENRTWEPPRALLGQRIAIHAGKKLDRDAMVIVRSLGGVRPPDDGGPEGIIGTARLLGVGIKGWSSPGSVGFRWAPGTTKERGDRAVGEIAMSQWFFGPYGWMLDDVCMLSQPIPCKGAQGLWTVPAEVEERVLAQAAGQP